MKKIIGFVLAIIGLSGLGDTPYWQAPLEKGEAAFEIVKCGGAAGEVSFVITNGQSAVRIVKRNDKGEIRVVSKGLLVPPMKANLRQRVKMTGDAAEPEFAMARVRFGKGKDFGVNIALDGRALNGRIAMQKFINTAPGEWDEKVTYLSAKIVPPEGVRAAIIVSGGVSDSTWFDWQIDDYEDAMRTRQKANGTKFAPRDYSGTMIEAKKFAADLAKDRNHTARLAKVNGVTRLLVDESVVPAAFFRGKGHSPKGKCLYAGAPMEEAGVTLQAIALPFSGTRGHPGFWTGNGFDAVAAANFTMERMRMAGKSLFALSMELSPPPEFSDLHPDEVWRLESGQVVTGNICHASIKVRQDQEKFERWPWISNHSLVWRAAAKEHIAALIAELKKRGADKRIIGIHLGGFHDGQFATAYPDFSPPAQVAYAKWTGRDAKLPSFGTKPCFDPVADRELIEAQTFLKRAPFAMQEDLMRHAKKCFGKPMIGMRWCMGMFSSGYCGSHDITPFVNSDAFDIIVPQVDYMRRAPGFALGSKSPTASFDFHGKMLVEELDLRTWVVRTAYDTEVRDRGLSRVFTPEKWHALNRKVTGQLMAWNSGWWYFDMEGGWFDDPFIKNDIAEVQKMATRMAAAGAWHPDVAFAVDEEALLTRNMAGVGVKPDMDVNNLIAEQLHLLASSGVPFDRWLLEDFIRNPELVQRYKMLVIAYPMKGREMSELAKRVKIVSLRSVKDVISPAMFNRMTREVGGYVASESGIEVDMNGDFMSVHALRNERRQMRWPNGKKFTFDAIAGRTTWFENR